MARAALRSISEAETAAQGQAYVEANGLTADVNINNQVASKVRDLGGDPLSAMFSADAADIAMVDRAVKLVAKDLIDPSTFTAPTRSQRDFALEDPSVTTSLSQPNVASAQLGDTAVDRPAMAEAARSGFATAKDYSGSRISELDNAGMSTEARTTFTELAKDITQATEGTMAGRLIGKVVQSSSELLGLGTTQAETMLQTDPLLQFDPNAARITVAPNGDGQTNQPVVVPDSGSDSVPPVVPHVPSPPQLPASYTPQDRDVMIRTIIGEAAGEGPEGMAAVALVIRNRMEDSRYPDTPGGVSLQPGQFSAWNTDGSGNDLVGHYGPGSDTYDKAALIADMVMGGQVPDFTKGAVNYYSPEGMRALVAQGYQDNLIPGWLSSANAERSGPAVQIGNQVFTGEVKE